MRQKMWPFVGISRGRRAGVLLVALLMGASTTASATEGPRYLALGDSFTAGTGALPSESFPARLVHHWKAKGHTVHLSNPAKNGYTTQDLIDEELPVLKTFKPTLVTLAIGANDLVRGADERRYRAQLRKIFQAILSAGVKPSAIFAIPQPAWHAAPVAEAFGDREALRAKIERFNTVLQEESKSVGARYIDLWPLMLKQKHDVAPDGLHPSASAYDAMAKALARHIKPNEQPAKKNPNGQPEKRER